MPETVRLSVSDGIAEIRLNRPARLNAINPDLLADFADALRAAQADPDVGVVLLCGEGRAFCAGDDLKEFGDQALGPDETRRFVESIQEITRLLTGGDEIVVGAIHGWAVGGGLEWVINCDFAVMAEDCRCFFPEAQLGLFVTGGVTTLLPNIVGLKKAKELILLGERFTAAEALDMGLVNKVVPADRHEVAARESARRIVDLPALARRSVKSVLNRAFQLPLDQAMALETDATVEGFLDAGTAERVTAALSGKP